MRKFLFLIPLSLLTAVTASAEDFTALNGDGIDISYNIIGANSASVTSRSSGTKYAGSLNIPDKVTYNETEYTVTQLGYKAFYDCEELTSVTIPETVTTIGDGVFYYCKGLTSLSIPNSVTSIGISAFRSCTKLMSATLSEAITSIDECVFYNCTALTSITIPNSVKTIKANAFDDCSNLTTVNFSDQLEAINEKAFFNCYSLTGLTFPTSLVTIGKEAFNGCAALTSLYIPGSVESIGDYAFGECKNLTKFSGRYASDDGRCLIVKGELMAFAPYGLTEYSIPEGVNEIGNYSFYNCTQLTSVTIPNSLTSIGYHSFAYCTGLAQISIPKNVYEIHSQAFEYCKKLKVVSLPESLKTMESAVFRGCEVLESMTIPKLVTTIPPFLFYNCYKLSSVTISGKITKIEYESFSGCSSLNSLTLPETITEIGGSAFVGTGIYNNNSNWEDNVLYIGKYLIKATGAINGDYTIKDGTIAIANLAFNDCTGLTAVNIPNTVTSINSLIFKGCTNLSSVNIPESITSIGMSAFEDCTSLAFANMPAAVTSIGESAFANCTSLKEITIPKNLTKLGEKAFYGCTSMNSVIIGAYIPPISSETFYGTNIIKCTYINYYDSNPIGAGLSVTFPKYGSLIENGCVWSDDQSELYSVSPNAVGEFVIPESVKSIGENAFKLCSSLTDITAQGLKAPTYEANNFDDLYDTANLNLTSGALYSYLNTCNWPMFKNIYVNGSKVTDFDDGTYKYLINPDCNEAIITGVNNPEIAAANIPASVEVSAITNQITAIGREAFKNKSSLATLTLPANLTDILDDAFSGCSALSQVTFPESVANIGDGAFTFCSNIEAFNGKCVSSDNKCVIVNGRLISFAPNFDTSYEYSIPTNVTYIAKDVFNGNTHLTSVIIPYSVKMIDDRAFNTPNLSVVKVESGERPDLGTDVFSNTSGNLELQVPESMVDNYQYNDLWSNSFTTITGFTKSLLLTDAEGYTINQDGDWWIDASYTRNFSSTSWHALCLPFDMDASDWERFGEMAQLANVSEGVMQWETVSGRGAKTEAGKPYIFKPSFPGDITFYKYSPSLKSCEYLPIVEFEGYKVQGNYVEKSDMAAINAYALHDGQFYYSNNPEKKLKPFRIFLTVPTPSSAPVRVLVDGKDVSGIEGITIDTPSTSAPAFNMLGIPVDDSYKGFVIINGQKILRK